MTTKLISLSTIASALVLAAGCSSVSENTPPPASGSVGTAPSYSSTSEAAQFGYVRNIQQHETARRSSGAGAILGAVIGGALGNQVGSGTGRAAATVIGAAGGAVAGNRIEENRAGSQMYYQVDVRLDNGDFRTFDYSELNGLRVGDRVRIEGNQLQRW
jgi:outer membrane lipoprotein SlyB